MSNDVVKVKRETIAACMTCPLCNNLFKQPTTISECLHTFCRKCIYDKFTDEDLECCPVCNIDLGCIPLEKLRPDHTKQDVRAKIFPLKGRKVKAPEPEVVAASEPLPAKRKERSLSSLVVNTPRVSVQTTMTGRRTKPTRKASSLRSSSFSIEKSIKKEAELLDDRPESSSSPEFSNKLRQNNGQSEGSQSAPNRVTENDSKTCDAKMDLWKPLNCLVEVASRTKSLKSNNIQGSDAKPEPAQANESGSQVQKIKNKEKKRKAKVEDESISPFPVSSDTAKPNKLRRVRRKKEPFGESGISSQAVVDSTGSKLFKGGPIWFSLVASENQEGDTPLPQIPASYVRIKDGSVPVSFIQKYLMKKLDLTSETEMPHLATTYAAVNTLITLGGDKALASINRDKLYGFMRRMKQPNGGFRMHDEGEIDVRACYTAISVASVLNILNDELIKNVGDFILSCQTYEGGIAGEPGSEAHGGYTFCGLAAMILIGEANRLDLPRLLDWVVFRQGKECGFQGRTNKLVDGCYSFWQGGAVVLLQRLQSVIEEQMVEASQSFTKSDAPDEKESSAGTSSYATSRIRREGISESCSSDVKNIGYNFINEWRASEPLFHSIALQQYILLCAQEQDGGLRDKPGKRRDHYHSCYCLSGLSLCQYSWSKLPDSPPLPKFSGINGVLYYTPQILEEAGVAVLLADLGLSSTSSSFLISAVTTLLMLPSIGLAMRLMDVTGRRAMAVPDPTQLHGLKLMKDYPYAEDGLLIWSAIENWVCTYVNYYYPNPSLIINDRVTRLVC